MRNLNQKNITLLHMLVAAFVFTVAGLFTGCDREPNYNIEVGGTWLWEDGQYEEKYVITDTRLEKYNSFSSDEPFLTYSIAEVYNDSFNSGETGVGDYGYALILLTEPPDSTSYFDDVKDYYTIFRWQNLQTPEVGATTADFSIGLYNPDNDLEYFKNPDQAEVEITAANGYFTSYSTGCELQEKEKKSGKKVDCLISGFVL